MGSTEMTIEQARAKLGDLVIKAMSGQSTTLTRYGKPVARIVPYSQEPTVITLYETNSDLLILARDGKAWAMGAPGASPGYLEGTFAQDSRAWAKGDWSPSEGDGQHPTEVGDDVTAVAQWAAGQGVRLLVDHEQLGAAAATYIGDLTPPTTYTLVSAVVGDQIPGVELADPECPITWEDLPAEAQDWAEAQGYGKDDSELIYVLDADAAIPTGFPIYAPVERI